jgi:hypothetical protein
MNVVSWYTFPRRVCQGDASNFLQPAAVRCVSGAGVIFQRIQVGSPMKRAVKSKPHRPRSGSPRVSVDDESVTYAGSRR